MNPILKKLFDKLTLPLDPNPGIGWGPFKLSDDHPFYRAAVVHDALYDDIVKGKSLITLKQGDRIFLRNCLRAAASQAWLTKDVGEGALLVREAWIFYRIVRAWAKVFRQLVEQWKPGDGPFNF